jgi:hypothetical protein
VSADVDGQVVKVPDICLPADRAELVYVTQLEQRQ